MYPVVAERSFVSCNLIMRSWLMLCSATADLSGFSETGTYNCVVSNDLNLS